MRKLKKVVAFLLALVLATSVAWTSVEDVNADTLYVDRQADVVFVIDVTGSMGSYISSVKTNLASFIDQINGEDVDVRVKFITFGDTTISEETIVSDWYSDADTANAYLESVALGNGGDEAETALDGMGQMFTSGFGFREDAFKFSVLLTDADTKIDNTLGYTCLETLSQKMKDNMIVGSVITRPSYYDDYEGFVTTVGGILGDITADDYSILLKSLAETVVGTVESLVVYDIYPTTCLVGEAPTITVTATGMVPLEDGFYVYLHETGTEGISDMYDNDVTMTDTGFTFTMGTGVGYVSTWDIVVVNGREAEDVDEVVIGQLNFVEKEEELDYKVINIEPATSKVGVETTVKVTVDKITYADDFAVTLGGVSVEVEEKEETYFTFKVPTTLSADTYDIIATNSTEKKIGKYVVTSDYTYVESEAPIEATGMTPNTALVGTTPTVKVTINRTTYHNDFKVTVGGVEAKVTAKKGTFFKFVMPKGFEAGEYEVIVTNGATETSVGTFTYTEPEPEPPIEITGMTPSTAEVGETPTVKVTVDSSNYKDDFKVTVGGVEAKVTAKKGTFFKFTMPAGFAAGDYEVVVTNGGTDTVAGTFTYTEPEPEPPIEITGMTPSTAEVGETPVVKVTVDSANYQDDFKVTVGGVEAEVIAQKGAFFKFNMPAGFAAGDYEVVVTNGGTDTVAGTFTFTEPDPVPPMTIVSFSKTSSNAGTAVTIKVVVEESNYEDDFAIMLGDVEMRIVAKKGVFFKFEIPKTMSAGTYDVVMINGGTSTVIGTYTLK